MKKWFGVFIFVAALTAMMFVPSTTYGAVPEKIEYLNVAKGKEAEFRSFEDFSKLQMFDYFYNNDGIDGTGCFELTGNYLTDGKTNKYNSVMGGLDKDDYKMAWAYIDLGQEYMLQNVVLHAVTTWPMNKVVVQISSDSTSWKTVFSGANGPILDNNGKTVYNEGLMTDAVPSSWLWDLTGHSLNSKTFYPASELGLEGYKIPFEVRSARYVRVTNLISEHTSGGASNNTAFSEIEVNAITKGVVAPTSSKKSGQYQTLASIELSNIYLDSKIYYTTDGSYPTTSSNLYSGAIDTSGFSTSFVIRAITVLDDGRTSLASDFSYTLGKYGNIALNIEPEFRSFDDFNQEVTRHDFNDPNFSVYTGNKITDGLVNGKTGVAKGEPNTPNMAWVYFDLNGEFNLAQAAFYKYGGWKYMRPIIQVSTDGEDWSTVFSGYSTELKSPNGTTIYNDGLVGIEGNENALSVNLNHSISSGYFMENAGSDGFIRINFDAENVRFVRLTALFSSHFDHGAPDCTIFDEIQLITSDAPSLPELEEVIVEIKEIQSPIDVAYKTEIDEVISKLPTSYLFLTNTNKLITAELQWACVNYNGSVAGAHIFTAQLILPQGTVNIFNLTPTVIVTVAQKADFSELVEKTNLYKNVEAQAYTIYSYTVFAEQLNIAESIIENESSSQQIINKAILDLVKSYESLDLLGDKTELNLLINECDLLEEKDYTLTSFNELKDVIESVKIVSENSDASESIVAKAYSDLLNVKNQLILRGDKSQLQQLVNSINDKNLILSEYTLSTRANFEDALEEAESLLLISEEESSMVELQRVYDALETADKNLIKLGDKSELLELHNTAILLKSNEYTSASFDAVEVALDIAKKLLDSDEADEQLVINAFESLKKAIDDLIKLGNKSLLNWEISHCDSLNENDFTSISIASLKTELNKAKAVSLDSQADEKKVNDAYTALKTARENLIALGDKTLLLEKITEYEALNKSDYTTVSYDALAIAIDNAKAVISQEATAEDINAAILALNTAKDALEKQSSGCKSTISYSMLTIIVLLVSSMFFYDTQKRK